MAVTGLDNLNFLRVSSGLGFLGGDPLFMAGWMFEPVGEDAGFLCELGETVSDDRRGLASSVGGNPVASSIEAGGLAAQATAAAMIWWSRALLATSAHIHR